MSLTSFVSPGQLLSVFVEISCDPCTHYLAQAKHAGGAWEGELFSLSNLPPPAPLTLPPPVLFHKMRMITPVNFTARRHAYEHV